MLRAGDREADFYEHFAWPQASAELLVRAREHLDGVEVELLELSTASPIETTVDYVLTLGKLSGFVKSRAQPLPGEKLLWQSIKLLNAMKIGYLMNK